MVLKKEISHQLIDILKENPHGLSITDIVSAININRNTVGRYLENLLVSGQVEMRRFGMSKIYQLSHRVPLSAILSLSSEFVMQLDSSLRIVFANEPFLNLVGTDSKNLLGKNIEYTPVTLVFEESFPAFIENLRTGIDGKEWSGEIELTTKGIILFCQIAPTVFEDGRKGVSVILEDITQRKQAEQKIEESELQFRLLAENSLDMICRIKPDYTLIYVSPVYKVTLGYLPEEVIGSSVEVFIHPEDAHILESLRIDLTPQKSSATIKFRLKHKDGHYILTETTVRAIFDENTQELSEYYSVTRDITERRRAEEALRDSESKLRSIADNSPDMILLLNPKWEILFINRAITLDPSKVLGKLVFDFIPQEFHDAAMTCFENVLKTGEVTIYGTEYHFPNGETSYFESTVGPIFQNGTVGALVINARDITERKRAEKELQKSEARYRTIFENTGAATVQIEENTIISLVNSEFERLSGFSKHEIEGKKSWMEFVVKEDLEGMLDMHRRRMEGQVCLKTYEFRFITKSGDIRTIYLTIDAILGSKKSIASLSDITERKIAETALRESAATARALINAPTDSVILMDSKGIILALNESAALRFGKRSNELVGVLTDDLLPEDLARSRRSLISQVLAKKEMVRFEDERDGRCFDTVAYPVINETGEVTKVAIVARDITYRRNIEEALIINEQRFRSLITAIGDIIWETDAHTHFVYVSPRVETLLGYKPDELIGHTPFEFLPQDAIAPNQKILQTAIERHERSVIQLSHWMHKDGKDILFESYVIPMYGSDSSFLGFIGIDRRQ
jgi:PAS domain S-box-containing protein